MNYYSYNKHKLAVEWFYEKPTRAILVKKPNNTWEAIYEPSWNVSYTYVINDEFAQLRKLLADGIPVELEVCPPNCDNPRWAPINKLSFGDPVNPNIDFSVGTPFTAFRPITQYKAGDWVNWTILPGEVSPTRIGYVENGIYYWGKDNTTGNILDDGAEFIGLWEPQQGELCMFWDDPDEAYVIAKYVTKDPRRYLTASHGMFDNIAPITFSLKDYR